MRYDHEGDEDVKADDEKGAAETAVQYGDDEHLDHHVVGVAERGVGQRQARDPATIQSKHHHDDGDGKVGVAEEGSRR